MKRLTLVLVACGSQAPAPPPAAPKSEPAAKAPSASPLERPVELPAPDSAGDNLHHTRERLAPLLAGANTCIPTDPDEDDMHRLEVGLDAFDDHLVACAEVPTRRGETVFFDVVSYACWNVEPSTAKLERRQDLARSYFECRDGGCPASDSPNHAIAYDGKSEVAFDPNAMTIAISPRAADGTLGTPRTIAAPHELAGSELMRGWLVYVGHAIFARGDAGFVAFDDRGKSIGSAPGFIAQVLDDTHVLVAQEGAMRGGDDDAPVQTTAAVLFDLAKRKTTKVTLSEPALARAVYFGGKAYAVAGRRLLELDPKTFAITAHHALAICP